MTSVLSTWNTFQSGTCRSPPPLEGGLHYRLLRPALATSGVEDPELATGHWTIEHLSNSPKKMGYNLTKRKESLRNKEEMKQERRKQMIDADGSWIPPTRQLVSRPHSWQLWPH